MEKVQIEVMNRAIKMLEALSGAGVEFAVKTADGKVVGNLKTETIKEKKPRNDFSTIKLGERIEKLSIGDVQEFEPPSGVHINRLQGAVSSVGCNKFGSGKIITARVGNKIQAMRVA